MACLHRYYASRRIAKLAGSSYFFNPSRSTIAEYSVGKLFSRQAGPLFSGLDAALDVAGINPMRGPSSGNRLESAGDRSAWHFAAYPLRPAPAHIKRFMIVFCIF
jgi:hypothetical protein